MENVLGALQDEMAVIRERIEKIDEEFLSGIFRNVLKEELDAKDSRDKLYLDN